VNGQLRTDKLRRAMRGPVLLPGEPGYDAARRVWNGAVDRHPAAIARCFDSNDVISAIRFAANEGIHPAVRGGGHSVAGVSVCDDGLVIDLSLMREVSIDPGRRRARVQGGHCGRTWTAPHNDSGWQPPAASSAILGSPGSPWAGGSAG
jgi:FAD/FMN-containing dehydrogenase